MIVDSEGPKKARRFLLVATFAPSLIRFRGELLRAAVARGHDVHCAAPDADDAIRETLEAWGVRFHDLPLERAGLDPFADMRSLLAIVRLCRRLRPDVVMGYTPKGAIYSTIAAGLAGTPHIVPLITGLGYAFIDAEGISGRIANIVSRALYAVALRFAHGAVVQNADNLARLREVAAMPRRLPVFQVAGSGVDTERFEESRLEPTGGGVRFLFLGRLVRYKGVVELAEAASEIKRLYPQTRFEAAGMDETGPHRLSPPERTLVLRALDWLGWIDDVQPLIERCHVYVLPSYGEGMPRSTLEALSMGRAVVTTAVSGCRETVEQGVNGFLVPPRDSAQLFDAMRTFVENPALVARMGRASRSLAVRRFDVRAVNGKMLEALRL